MRKRLVGYGALVRDNRSFRLLWLGQIVSLLGDWFNLIASATIVSHLTGSGAALGGLFVVRMLAPFFASPVAGVLADRFSRKALLVLSDLARAVIVLGFLLVRDPGDIWLLYALTMVQLGISGLYYPARNAFLPNVVGDRELGAANALSSATWSVMLALGTALGGLTAGLIGPYSAFVVDSGTFLVSAGLVSLVVTPQAAAAPAGDARARRIRFEGLRFLKGAPHILAVALVKPLFALTASGALQVFIVALGERVFPMGRGGAISMGLLYACVGVGTGFGPIIARRFVADEEHRLRAAIALGFVIASAGLALVSTLSHLGVVMLGLMLEGCGGGMLWVFSTLLLMQLTPDAVRGRVFGTEFALFALCCAAGATAGGWVLDSAGGLHIALASMAGLVLMPCALWVGAQRLFEKRMDD